MCTSPIHTSLCVKTIVCCSFTSYMTVDPHLGCHSTRPKPPLHLPFGLHCTSWLQTVCVSSMLPCPSHRTPTPSDVGLVEGLGGREHWQILPHLSCQCSCPSECKTNTLPQLSIWTCLVPYCTVQYGSMTPEMWVAADLLHFSFWSIFITQDQVSYWIPLCMFKTGQTTNPLVV